MSPASACCLRSCRRSPIRSTSAALWRPFSVCRGRRQRNFFAQRLGQLRTADPHPLAGLDLRAQPGNGPVRPVRHRRLQQGRHHPQRRLALHRGRPRRHPRPQRCNTAARIVAAPQPHRVFADAERFADPRTGPARQRQQHRPRPVRLATITRRRQSLQRQPLLGTCRHRRLARHPAHLRIDPGSESQPGPLGKPQEPA